MNVHLAPAKINLFLDIEGKRKDGYHNINTVFLKIGIYDRLSFKKEPRGIKVVCAHPRLFADQEHNLVYKAARLLRKSAGIKTGVRIHLKKNIPVGGGLGGGSSDAATTLLALNKLWRLKLSRKQLTDIGKKLGADVPFFLLPDTAAQGRGKGDRLKGIKLKKKFWILLVIPEVCVTTKEVYAALPGRLTKTEFDVKLLFRALKDSDMETMAKSLFNRLESVTLKKYKLLAKIKKMVSALGVRAVLMSGSGSVIFGIVRSREEGMRIKRKLPGIHKVMVVRSL